MSREIKPSNCTHFPVGAKVKITNSGRCYSTYRDMYEYMGLTCKMGFNPFNNGEIGIVVAKAIHESEHCGEVLAVRVEGGVALIGATGVTHYEAPVVKEPTVDELKAELAATKAKLWEAEWKLAKIIEVASKGIN